MATQYHVYGNDGAGGPVDYSTPIGTTATLSFSPPALATPSDNTFAVRAFDTVSTLEELNTDCRVRIVIDASGVDITTRPNAPSDLAAVPTAGGGARVSWSYNAAGQGGAPTSFKVWLTVGGVVNYGVAPSATATYSSGRWFYSVDLTGLVHGTDYAVGVRATNATGDELNTLSTSVRGDNTGPDPVENLAASAG